MRYIDTRDAVWGELLVLANEDKNVVVLTCDTGARKFAEFPKEQFFNVGIAEQNAMSVAAGLAMEGKKVFVYGITNFVLLRCYEQIKVDICAHKLPVTIIGMGTGYQYSSDGITHHMTESTALLRALQNMTTWMPSDYEMSARLVHEAYACETPSFLLIDRGPFSQTCPQTLSKGINRVIMGGNVGIVASGIMVSQAMEVSRRLNNEIGVIDCYMFPLNVTELVAMCRRYEKVYALEEHVLSGGLGGAVCEALSENMPMPVDMLGIKEYRHVVGDREYMRSQDALDVESLVRKLGC